LSYLYWAFSALISIYAVNNIYLIWSTKKYRGGENYGLKRYPKVSVQLPIYNDKEVVPRLIDSVMALDWPKEALEIMILDDSTDETSKIIYEKIKDTDLNIKVIRRKTRKGYKAGALQEGTERTDAKYIAIFDADFIPESSYLKKIIPQMEKDAKIGLVQARWGHINQDFNKLTRAISLGLDWHHHIEQVGRNAANLFINFNGSCGVIRKKAILDAGGWNTDTLSEDLDISYRIQMKKWKAVYRKDVIVPGEIPPTINDYRTQQTRWAKGSIQCSRMLLGKILSSDLGIKQKAQAILHLNGYSVYLWTILLLLLSIPCLMIEKTTPITGPAPLGTISLIGILSEIAVFYVLWRSQHRSLKILIEDFLFLFITSLGLSLDCSLAVVQGLVSNGGEFLRTPKHNIINKGAEVKISSPPNPKKLVLYIGLTLYSTAGIALAASQSSWGMLIYFLLNSAGFMTIILLSLKPELF